MSELTPKVNEKKHTVTYDITYTANLGNFESAKVTVGLSMEGYGNPEPTFAKVKEWVDAKLEEQKPVIDSLRN